MTLNPCLQRLMKSDNAKKFANSFTNFDNCVGSVGSIYQQNNKTMHVKTTTRFFVRSSFTYVLYYVHD